jgi:hypothetical protein
MQFRYCHVDELGGFVQSGPVHGLVDVRCPFTMLVERGSRHVWDSTSE